MAGVQAASWEVPGDFMIRGNIQPALMPLLITCANEGSGESQTMSNPELQAPFIPFPLSSWMAGGGGEGPGPGRDT